MDAITGRAFAMKGQEYLGDFKNIQFRVWVRTSTIIVSFSE